MVGLIQQKMNEAIKNKQNDIITDIENKKIELITKLNKTTKEKEKVELLKNATIWLFEQIKILSKK